MFTVFVYYVCILQFSCFTKYNRMQSKHKKTNCKHRRPKSYRLQLFWQVSLYQIKELFKETILNLLLNFHVYWDTLYHPHLRKSHSFKQENFIVFVFLFIIDDQNLSHHITKIPVFLQPKVFQTINYVGSNNLSLKYQRFTPSVCGENFNSFL